MHDLADLTDLPPSSPLRQALDRITAYFKVPAYAFLTEESDGDDNGHFHHYTVARIQIGSNPHNDVCLWFRCAEDVVGPWTQDAKILAHALKGVDGTAVEKEFPSRQADSFEMTPALAQFSQVVASLAKECQLLMQLPGCDRITHRLALINPIAVSETPHKLEMRAP